MDFANNHETKRGNPAWVKGGGSPNPSGRSKKLECLKSRCEQLSPAALETVESIMLSTESKDADRLAACRVILEYAYGKPSQRTEITGPDGGPIALGAVDLRNLTDEELIELERLTEKISFATDD